VLETHVTPSPTSLTRWLGRLARAALWLVAIGWLLFALSWGALHGWIVPRVDSWRPTLERMASRALGIEVRVGHVRAESVGPVPALWLEDVVLQDADGRPALRLSSVQASLSLRSLWRLGFDQLVIDAPQLDIRRTADGQLLLAGLPMGSGAEPGSDGGMLDWLWDQTELAIRGGSVRWTDEQRPTATPLDLQAIALVIRHQGRQHEFRFDATPPPEWGQPFTLQGQFTRPLWPLRTGQWRDWSGTAYAHLPGIDAQALGRYIDLEAVFGLQGLQGRGSARLWADVQRGRVAEVTADLALPEVALHWPQSSGPFVMRELQTRLALQAQDRSLRVHTQGLAFVTAEGRRWPGGDLRYEHTLSPEGQLLALSLSGQGLDAQALRQLAEHLPLPEAIAHWLQASQATGRADTLQLQWEAAQGADAARWSARGQLRQVGLRAGEVPAPIRRPSGRLHHPAGRPGVQGLDIDFELNQSGGQAQLRMRDGHFVVPGVFEAPLLPLQRLEAELQWQVQDGEIRLDIPRLALANEDLEAEVGLQWRTADPASSPAASRFPGLLTLDAHLPRARADRVVRYLPQDLPPSVRRYLLAAISAGQVREGRIQVAGDLWDFPFDAPDSGRFVVSAWLQGVGLQYAPRELLPPESLGWPALQVERARLDIDRTRLSVSQAQAYARDWPQLRLSQVQADLADFAAEAPWLQVRGQVQGPAQAALSMIRSTALRGLTGGVLDRAQASGATELALELQLPLQDMAATRVQGLLRLSGNDLIVAPEAPGLQGIHGSLRFHEKGFEVPVATARLLGGGVRFSGGMGSGPDRAVVFQGQGLASVEALSQAPYWPWLAPLGQVAAGQAPYQAQLRWDALGTSFEVESSLQGLSLRLPAPFDKAASASLPLRLAMVPQPPGPGAQARDRIALALGSGPEPLLSLAYLREFQGDEVRVLAGSVAVRSAPLPLPRQGVQAQLQLPTVDVQAWQAVGERLRATPGPQRPAGGSSDGRVDATRVYWPTEIGLVVQRLAHSGRAFHRVVAGGSHTQGVWRLSVGADELSGYVEYRSSAAHPAGELYARLERLHLSAAATRDVESLLQHPPTPLQSQLPAIDLVVERFQMHGRALGRLEIQAVNRPAVLGGRDLAPQWRLNRLLLSVPEARLQASGQWGGAGGASAPGGRTALDMALEIDDAGQLLERLGMPGVVRGGQGKLQGQIAWQGAPWSLHTPSLSGALTIDMGRGQFLKAEPGMAKLLGVLSLQSLPRRLALDFRDVFSEGFSFDELRGHALVREGVATTHNLQMRGVSAAVWLEGQADMVRETQDITAVVIPELNAGTAALLATMVNPVTGLGSFLAQFLLRQPLQEATTRQFRVTGPWADPVVERIARRSVSASDPSAPSASPP
jgi:uncharacterized protein (TIGR02099 family)